MSSPYSILDNRPIDQWKVTELKEELRRRRLAIKGLKEDLVKRLDEAIRNEGESLTEKELDNGFDPDSKSEDKYERDEWTPVQSSKVSENVNEDIAEEIKKVDCDMVTVDSGTPSIGLGTDAQHEVSMGINSFTGVVDETAVPAVSVENSVPDSDTPNGDMSTGDNNNSTPYIGQGSNAQHEMSMGVTSLTGAIDETAAPAVSAGNIVPDSDVFDKLELSSQDSTATPAVSVENSVPDSDVLDKLEFRGQESTAVPAVSVKNGVPGSDVLDNVNKDIAEEIKKLDCDMVTVDSGTPSIAQGTDAQHEVSMGINSFTRMVDETAVPAVSVENSVPDSDVLNGDMSTGDNNNSTPDIAQGSNAQDEMSMGVTSLTGAIDETATPAVSAGNIIPDSDVFDKLELSSQDSTEAAAVSVENSVPDSDVLNKLEFRGQESTTAPAVSVKNGVPDSDVLDKLESRAQDSSCEEKNEDSKPSTADMACNSLEPDNQVSEVSPDLGFQVKCESISTDSVLINEKNELEDNLNAENFPLDLEVVKQELTLASSSDVASIGGDLHPLSSDQETGGHRGCMEERDDVPNMDVNLSKKNYIAGEGSPEKLNLDRSSGDESMEEDVWESKQIESNNGSDEVGDMREVHELHVVKEGTPPDVAVGGLSPDKEVIVVEENRPPVAAEKRKLEDQEPVGTTEPVKRQRRWNVETIKVPELQASNLTSSGIPKDAYQPTPRHTFSLSDSVRSGDSLKERIVPPSQKTATTSLRIDHFLRPFTLKAVQELLAKTGSVCSFWMDQIKTHCYVTYSSVDEAIATRNALYNLQWPTNGGHLLIADFLDPQEVKTHIEAPQSPAPVSVSLTTPSAPSLHQPQDSQPQDSQPPMRQHNLRQQLPPLPPPPPLFDVLPARECLPPPPSSKQMEPPILTLDDLFRKTRATPRIYYLPLAEEQVAAKLAAHWRNPRE